MVNAKLYNVLTSRLKQSSEFQVGIISWQKNATAGDFVTAHSVRKFIKGHIKI